MAGILNGKKESPPDSGDSSPDENIPNGNKESLPQLAYDVVKVVVIGEPRCGKTRFIRAYYDHNFPSDMYSHNGVRVYPCSFVANNLLRKMSIFEIPGDPDFLVELRTPHYIDADIVVFVYAIDDPSSIQMLNDKWIPEAINTIVAYKLPVLFLGTKQDLRYDRQTIERLALEHKTPVSLTQGLELLNNIFDDGAVLECSAFDLNKVEHAFKTISALALINE